MLDQFVLYRSFLLRPVTLEDPLIEPGDMETVTFSILRSTIRRWISHYGLTRHVCGSCVSMAVAREMDLRIQHVREVLLLLGETAGSGTCRPLVVEYGAPPRESRALRQKRFRSPGYTKCQ
jgi:hypothetical protein